MDCLKNMIPLSLLFSRAMNLIPSKRSRLYFLIKKKGWKGINKSTHHRRCIPPPFLGILQIVASPMIVVVHVQDQIQLEVGVLPLVDNCLDRTRFPFSINSCPTIDLNAKYVSRVNILLWTACTISSMPNSLWYSDSGASHHVTNDSTNYTSKSYYNGVDQVKLGNGTGLSITHIGSASLSSLSNSSSFVLNKLLHVPHC